MDWSESENTGWNADKQSGVRTIGAAVSGGRTGVIDRRCVSELLW